MIWCYCEYLCRGVKHHACAGGGQVHDSLQGGGAVWRHTGVIIYVDDPAVWPVNTREALNIQLSPCTVKPVLGDVCHDWPPVLNDRCPRHGSFLIITYYRERLPAKRDQRPHKLFRGPLFSPANSDWNMFCRRFRVQKISVSSIYQTDQFIWLVYQSARWWGRRRGIVITAGTSATHMNVTLAC